MTNEQNSPVSAAVFTREAAVEERVDLLALVETRERAVLPEDGRRVGERAFETVVAALERAVAKLHSLVENLPETGYVAVRGKRDVDEVDGDDALVEAPVILRLARLVVAGARDIVEAVAGAVGGEERTAAHARVRIAVAGRLAL